MEFDFSGSYVNFENCAENSILTIITQPVPQEKESSDMVIVDGVIKKKKYMVLNMEVEYDSKQKTYTPDAATGKRFQHAWGRDCTKWVGKQFTAKIEAFKAFGQERKRISGYPLTPEKVK